MSVSGGRNGGGRWRWYLLAGIAALVAGLLLSHLLPGSADGNMPRVVYLVALLALLGGGGLARVARQPGPALRRASTQMAIWIGIGLVLLLGYGYRVELRDAGHRLSDLLLPAQARVAGDGSMRVTLEDDSQFHVEGLIGGRPVRFLVDTGASDVLLSPADARRLGFDPATLAYNRVYRTASGTARGAPVTLPEIVIGTIRLTEVGASVSERDTGSSLLGMSFLGRLSGFAVSGDTLTLRQ
jgi:aspartyl protease family protein